MFEFLSFWFLFLFTNLIIMCSDGNFQATKLDPSVLLLDTRVLELPWKSCQMPRNFTEKRVSSASGYKGSWIFAKIPSNAPMFSTLAISRKNPLIVLLVTRVENPVKWLRCSSYDSPKIIRKFSIRRKERRRWKFGHFGDY